MLRDGIAIKEVALNDYPFRFPVRDDFRDEFPAFLVVVGGVCIGNNEAEVEVFNNLCVMSDISVRYNAACWYR